jgi:hypothetical protein
LLDYFVALSLISLGYSVVEKIYDLIRYGTDTILANVKVGIGNPDATRN